MDLNHHKLRYCELYTYGPQSYFMCKAENQIRGIYVSKLIDNRWQPYLMMTPNLNLVIKEMSCH